MRYHHQSTIFLLIVFIFLSTHIVYAMDPQKSNTLGPNQLNPNNWKSQSKLTILDAYDPHKTEINNDDDLLKSFFLIKQRPAMPLPPQVETAGNLIDIPSADTIHYHFGIERDKNKRDTQEDRACVHDLSGGQFFAIYDGYFGKDVSRYLFLNLHTVFEQKLSTCNTIKTAFEETFEDCDQEIKNCCLEGGATAVVVYSKENSLHCAWIGDCGCAIESNGKLSFGSPEHTLKNEQEKKRVQEAGGTIFREVQESYFGEVKKSYAGPLRINSLLFTRAFGCFCEKGQDIDAPTMQLNYQTDSKISMHFENENGWRFPEKLEITPKEGQIIVTPEYKQISLSEQNRWLILASSGVWRAISQEKAVEIVTTHSYPETPQLNTLAQLIALAAKNKGSNANLTILVVDLWNKTKNLK